MNDLNDPSFFPTETGRVDNVEQSFHGQGLHNGAQLGFIMDSLISLTPRDIASTYLQGHLLGRARDWFEIFGSTLVQKTAKDFAQLKEALTKYFPLVRNRKDLKIQFYSSQQSRGQEPTDFIHDLLKVYKKLVLNMSEEALEVSNDVRGIQSIASKASYLPSNRKSSREVSGRPLITSIVFAFKIRGGTEPNHTVPCKSAQSYG
ncbi:uncharacterized protein TNCV_903131 [Trichonephila clavipes]|nr:uncharacterized protein TNCV_903131 [Trichonephila clavipes]